MSDRIVVMNAGRIVQHGSPRDIYETPKNLFVANFIGESNIMDGRLLARQADGSWLASVEGRECLVHTQEPFNEGDAICVLLRPEDMRMAELDEQQDSSQLVGHIVERNYKGATLDSVIRLQSGRTLQISEFFDEDDPDFDYQLGQKVAISWVDSWEVVLPYEAH